MFFYVFADKGVPDACKIGTSSKHESRYRQARCHTPRGIRACAFFDCGTTDASRSAEAAAKKLLRPLRRAGQAKEWFNISPDAAVSRLTVLPELYVARRLSNPEPKLKSSDLQYDDWREQRSQFRAYKWRLFLFEEQSSFRCLKLSYGALYETAYRYVFTYNPFPVLLIAGFDDPSAPERQASNNVSVNDRIVRAWTEVQKELGSLLTEEVGWLKPGTDPRRVCEILARHGLEPFNLSRPKPLGAPARETSISPPTPFGTSLPQDRVRPCAAIYGSK
jgi:hypothetical protein